jgi:hypothetical protein
MRNAGKQFFFEKKNQKTFATQAPGVFNAGGLDPKDFFASFCSQTEVLNCAVSKIWGSKK